MNSLIKVSIVTFLTLVSVSFIACSGNTDEDEKAAEVVLSPSALKLVADGEDAVTFVVQQGGVDVTQEATIRCVTRGNETTGKTFTTTEAGTYEFEAVYGGIVSKKVTLTAIAPVVTASKYVRHIAAMKFTGTWCPRCPAGGTILDLLTTDGGKYENVAYQLAFHQGDDPMAIAETDKLASRFRISAYPSIVVDMRDKNDLNVASIVRELFDKSLKEYPAHCGVAIGSVCNEARTQVTVTVRLTSETVGNYRLVLYVLEDGLKYDQSNSGLWTKDFVHNHVVRERLSGSLDGDDIGTIAAGSEFTKVYTVDLDSKWNVEKLSFYVMAMDEAGYVNNVAVCKAIGGMMDYDYVN